MLCLYNGIYYCNWNTKFNKFRYLTKKSSEESLNIPTGYSKDAYQKP